MLLNCFRKRAEYDAQFRQLVLERRRNRHAVKNSVYSYASEHFLFFERYTKLFVSLQQFGIDLIQTVQLLLLGR